MFGLGGVESLIVLGVFTLLYGLVLAMIVGCGVVLGNLATAYLDPYLTRLRELGRERYRRRHPEQPRESARQTVA